MTDGIPPIEFRKPTAEESHAAREQAALAVQERRPLTAEEIAAGWSEDPVSELG